MRLLSALAILFLLGPAVSSASNQRSDSDGSAGDPSHAAELRRAFGFDSDPATVARAAVDSASFPNRTYGIPLSLDEAAEVSRRIRVQLSLGGAITELETRPDWAGVWIDQEAGAVPVFQFAGEGEVTTRFGDELLIEQGNRAVADVCPETQCYPLKGGIGMLGKGDVDDARASTKSTVTRTRLLGKSIPASWGREDRDVVQPCRCRRGPHQRLFGHLPSQPPTDTRGRLSRHDSQRYPSAALESADRRIIRVPNGPDHKPAMRLHHRQRRDESERSPGCWLGEH